MANNIHDVFDEIKADSRLKESTKQFLEEQRAGKRRMRQHPLRKAAAAAMCILALFAAGIGGYSWIQAPVSYVSIDVNPSVELALNKLDRVVDVAAFNAEGASIVEGLPLKWKKYTDAINLIVESSGMESYLSDDAELVFTVAASGIRSEKLQSGIAHCHSQGGHNCYSVSADIGLVSEAHENGLSLGKYNAYLQLAAYDDTITVDDCRDMSMSEIHQCIRAHGQHGNSGHGHHNHGCGSR